MESKRVPKVGETWKCVDTVGVVVSVDGSGCPIENSKGKRFPFAFNEHCANQWAYVSGPSDAPAPKADVCAWPGCGLPQSFAGHNGCGKQLYMCDTVACHYFTGATETRITQAAVADELEKRAKDIPSSSPVSAGSGDAADTEAARGGEVAVIRADTMAGCTESDMRPNWPALTHAGCSRSVACNVCVPPVKREPWVDSLAWDWDLPDAV